MKRTDVIAAVLLVGFIIFIRLIPHIPNATPVAAAALAGGVYLRRYWGLAIPLIGMALSDIFIGFYDWHLMLSVYGSFALVGLLSWWLKKNKNIVNIVFAGLLASVLFFIITNAVVWLYSPWYTKDLVGLLYSYELALPFFRNTLGGNFAYIMILFGSFESVYLIQKALAKRRLSTA